MHITYIHTNIHKNIHTLQKYTNRTYIHACMHTYIHTYMQTHYRSKSAIAQSTGIKHTYIMQTHTHKHTSQASLSNPSAAPCPAPRACIQHIQDISQLCLLNHLCVYTRIWHHFLLPRDWRQFPGTRKTWRRRTVYLLGMGGSKAGWCTHTYMYACMSHHACIQATYMTTKPL